MPAPGPSHQGCPGLPCPSTGCGSRCSCAGIRDLVWLMLLTSDLSPGTPSLSSGPRPELFFSRVPSAPPQRGPSLPCMLFLMLQLLERGGACSARSLWAGHPACLLCRWHLGHCGVWNSQDSGAFCRYGPHLLLYHPLDSRPANLQHSNLTWPSSSLRVRQQAPDKAQHRLQNSPTLAWARCRQAAGLPPSAPGHHGAQGASAVRWIFSWDLWGKRNSRDGS